MDPWLFSNRPHTNYSRQRWVGILLSYGRFDFSVVPRVPPEWFAASAAYYSLGKGTEEIESVDGHWTDSVYFGKPGPSLESYLAGEGKKYLEFLFSWASNLRGCGPLSSPGSWSRMEARPYHCVHNCMIDEFPVSVHGYQKYQKVYRTYVPVLICKRTRM